MKIYAPNKDYSGLTAGVRFVNGVGETENEYILFHLQRKGYRLEDTVASAEAEKILSDKDDEFEGEEKKVDKKTPKKPSTRKPSVKKAEDKDDEGSDKESTDKAK